MPTPASSTQAATTGLDVARRRKLPGFTLVEMMVVVALIGILAAVVGVSMSGNGQSMSLQNAQRNLVLMMQAAQSAAQKSHTRARFIIFADKNWVPESSPESATVDQKILRFYGIVTAMSDDPTVKTAANVINNAQPYHVWSAVGEGSMLPEGIYFVPSQQSQFALDLPGFAGDTKHNAITDTYSYPNLTTLDEHPGVTTGMMQITFPLQEAIEGTGDWYYFIEFAPDGFYYNTNGNNNIYIGAGVNPTANTVDFLGTGATPSRMFSGLQLRMLGGAEAFRSPDDFMQNSPSGGGN